MKEHLDNGIVQCFQQEETFESKLCHHPQAAVENDGISKQLNKIKPNNNCPKDPK